MLRQQDYVDLQLGISILYRQLIFPAPAGAPASFVLLVYPHLPSWGPFALECNDYPVVISFGTTSL
jgi:hypothetical protein